MLMNRKPTSSKTKIKKRRKSTNKPKVIDPLYDMLRNRGGYRR